MEATRRKLFRHGAILFLLAMISGFLIPVLENPRLGLSSHLIGVIGGAFVMAAGAAWHHLRLGPRMTAATYFLLLYSIYADWASTLLGGFWGVGADLMPMAAGEHAGGGWQNMVVNFGLFSLSITSVLAGAFLIYGFRGAASETAEDA